MFREQSRREDEMTTMERHRDDTRTTTSPSDLAGPTKWIPVVLGLVLALVVGGLAGYLIRGDDMEETGSVVPVGGTEVTSRQEEMADLMAEYEQAWLAGDGEAAEAVFGPGGTLRALGVTYHADDGEIADFVGGPGWTVLEILEPMLVYDDVALNFHTYDGLRTNVMTFTDDGEVKILSHVISGVVGG